MANIRKRATSAGEARYDVSWRVDGREVSRTFRRRSDADAFVRQLYSEELRGVVVDPRNGRESLEDYAKRWLSTRLVRGRPLAGMTLTRYRSLLRHHLTPLTRSELRHITPDAVGTWHSALVSTAGADTAAKAYRLLRAILNSATDEDLIARNPCRIKGAGQERPDERPMLDTSTVLRLADAIDHRYRALILLAGFGGLRTGECLGLERRDIDVLHGRVEVKRQAQELPTRGRMVSRPKSEAGRRPVALPEMVTDALVVHMAAYTGAAPDAVVFLGPGGEPLRRATLSAAWRRATAAAGLGAGVHVHDLRHHGATLMARMPGVTTAELMARLGHSSPRAALIYQHATEDRDRAIAGFLDDQARAAAARAPTPIRPEPRDARGMGAELKRKA